MSSPEFVYENLGIAIRITFLCHIRPSSNYFRFCGRHLQFRPRACITWCQTLFRCVERPRKRGFSHLNHHSVSYTAKVISTSGLLAAILTFPDIILESYVCSLCIELATLQWYWKCIWVCYFCHSRSLSGHNYARHKCRNFFSNLPLQFGRHFEFFWRDHQQFFYITTFSCHLMTNAGNFTWK
jgi:hypothetical protein